MVGLVFCVFLERCLLIMLHQCLTFTMLLKGKLSNLGLIIKGKALATTHLKRDDCYAFQADSILADLDATLQLDDLPPNVRQKLKNLYGYFSTQKNRIDYARFKELGLPIGSGLVESTCKWLIQQRFIDQEGMRV